MKALSIKQPWAWLIVNGHKDIENRDWKYPPKHRAPLLIHASKSCTKAEYDACKVFAAQQGVKIPPLEELDRGGIVGSAVLNDCVTESDSPWFFGRIGLVLTHQKTQRFVEWKGQLGIFEVNSTKWCWKTFQAMLSDDDPAKEQ